MSGFGGLHRLIPDLKLLGAVAAAVLGATLLVIFGATAC
jgi:hypothetical protein